MRNLRWALSFALVSAFLVRCGSSSDGGGALPDASVDGSTSSGGQSGSSGDAGQHDAATGGGAQSDASPDVVTADAADAAIEPDAEPDAAPDASDAGVTCCTLITSSEVPWDDGLVVDDSSIYWYVDSTKLDVAGVWSVSKSGGTAAQLGSVMNQSFDRPAVSGGKLWWADTRPDGVPEYLMHADLTTGAVSLAYDDDSLTMGSVFLDRTTNDWYWSNESSGAGQMYVYHPSATSLVPFGAGVGSVAAFGAADAVYFYGHEGPSIAPNALFRMARANGAKETYSSIPSGSVYALGADGASLFFWQANQIWSVPKGTLAATPTAIVDAPGYSLVDGSDVFTWTVSAPGITKATGATKTVISTGTLIPYQIAVDASFVYFVTSAGSSGDYEIWRVPRS
jgi:hypothetical protein